VLSHAVRGREIGSGVGRSRGHAKKEAAIRALSTLLHSGFSFDSVWTVAEDQTLSDSGSQQRELGTSGAP